MTKAKLVKFKFKEGSKQIWLDWTEELKRRKDEVVKTLKNEGVVSESCFISEDGNYVYYFMEAEDFEKARNALVRNPHPIDDDHKIARDSSLEFIATLECLFHFNNK